MLRTMLFALALAVIPAAALAADPPSEAASFVKPIHWERFQSSDKPDVEYTQCQELLLNSVRYCLGWAAATYPLDAQGDSYQFEIRYDEEKKKFARHEDVFRPGCNVAFAAAVALKTNAYSEKQGGLPRDEALWRARYLIKGLASRYRPHASGDNGWGDEWQSALWASLLGNAGWMLWDDLDDETRRLLAALVEHEADRFIGPNYHVPYWANREKILSPGDTKAEENAWNSLILQLAVAMMPAHPRAQAWRESASRLIISTYARRIDWEHNETVLDGKPVKDWLEGYNIRRDGALENHGIIHPDYIPSATHTARPFVLMSLAGLTTPEAAGFNGPVAYRALVTKIWKSPPHKSPGGTIYIPGEASVYYPQGTDWSKNRLDAFYRLDTYADALHWDDGLPTKARSWMNLRAKKMLEMQSRHADGRMYDEDEFKTYPAPEQNAAGALADSYLVQWLNHCGALNKTQANWLE